MRFRNSGFFYSALVVCVQIFRSRRLSGKGESSKAVLSSSKSIGDQSQRTTFMPLSIEKGQSETA